MLLGIDLWVPIKGTPTDIVSTLIFTSNNSLYVLREDVSLPTPTTRATLKWSDDIGCNPATVEFTWLWCY
jgi:hypothetical protein